MKTLAPIAWQFAVLRLAAVAVAASLVLAGCRVDTTDTLISSGKTFYANQEYREAAIQFKSALQTRTDSTELRYMLGMSLLSSGDPFGAVLELSKALDQKHDANLVLPALARALLLTGDYRGLSNLYGEMTLSDPIAMASLKSSVASAWGALGEPAKTEAAMAAALQAVPEYGPALVLKARLIAGRRDFDAATQLVDAVLAKDSRLHEAWQLRGELASVDKGDTAAAEAAFRKALELQPSHVPSHLALISSRLRARDIAGATEQAEALRQLMPKHPQTAFVTAQIAFTNGEFTKARELAQQLLKLAPSHVGVLQLAGAVESQSGSLMLAEVHFNKALQQDPTLKLARRSLAQIYLRLGQTQRALDTLQPLLRGSPPDADAHSLAGDAYLRLGDSRAAEAQFVQAVRLNPDNLRMRTSMALTHIARGDPATAFSELQSLAAQSTELIADQAIVSARLKRREYDAALLATQRMVRKEPGNALVHELRGQVQLARRDYKAAREAFEFALKLDPSLFAAVANLAVLDFLVDEPERAQRRLEEAVRLDPRNHHARMTLAQALERNGAPLDEVKKQLADAITLAPTDRTPRLQLIDLTLRKRQYKEALTVAQAAAAALPDDPAVLDAVGQAQAEVGNIEQAVTTFRRLAGVDHASGAPYVRLADVYQSVGRTDAAATALRRAVEIEPGLARAQEALVKLMLEANRLKEVVDVARGMQSRHPTQAHGYALEAMVQLRAKAPDLAMTVFRKGLAVPGQDPELARLFYAAQLKAGRSAEADHFGEQWMRANPDDVAFDYQMAVTAITRGRLDEAETRLRRVVDQRPSHPLGLNNLAWVLAKLGKPGSVALAEKAVELRPDSAALIDTLAIALAAEKQPEKALQTQKRAVDIAPEDNGLRLNLARIALQAGEKDLAREELQRLHALGPDYAFRQEVDKLMRSL